MVSLHNFLSNNNCFDVNILYLICLIIQFKKQIMFNWEVIAAERSFCNSFYRSFCYWAIKITPHAIMNEVGKSFWSLFMIDLIVHKNIWAIFKKIALSIVMVFPWTDTYHQHYADNVTNNNNTKEPDSFGKYYNKSQNEKFLNQQQVNGNYPQYNRENISRSYTDHGINNRLARVNNESNVFHHYHSIHHSKKKPRNKYDTSREDENEDIQSTNHNALVFDEHVERSLANASFAAVNMEQISKRMLKSIATDLFNSGASEYWVRLYLEAVVKIGHYC